jgi:outer membrane receptor protein involved in Fe transport
VPTTSRSLALGAVSLLALLSATPPAIAAPAPATLAFVIPPGSLESALTAYATRANIQLLYTPDLVRGRRSNGLMGEFTAQRALDRLLAGSGIIAEETRPGVIVLRMGVVATPLTDVQSEVAATPSVLDEVVVTGTHIRGVTPGPSPIVVVDRDEIDRQGYATVADTLSALPQNFSGAATPDVGTTGMDQGSVNVGRATAINLRGLGPDATLVLVNGRRMAGTGGNGDFADVSAIPTAAVERIDILLDGASALYGADAVGGVVNIILKRDFDGAETRLRYGGAQGGAREVLAAQTVGRTWESGHALISYEYYDRDALPFAARPYTASADFRPYGGADRRTNISSPGNIVLTDPATNAATPTWGIPAGRSPLRPSDFVRGVLNFQEPRLDQDLLPSQTRHSVYAAIGQTLSSRAKLSGDLRYSRRSIEGRSTTPTAAITVSDSNPYFVSPNGSRSHQIYYSFARDLGPVQQFATSESLGTSFGLDLDLWGDWQGEAYLAYGRDLVRSGTNGNLNSAFLREAVGAVADNATTPFKTSIDGFFNPFGDGDDNSAGVLAFIGSGYGRQRYESTVASFNTQADGRLLALPGGDLRMAIGIHGREESFVQRVESFTAAVTPSITASPTYKRQILAGFAELRAPLVGPANVRPGLQALELSLALRTERYDDFGVTTNPKFGLTWVPLDGLKVRGTYGRSFRAPKLTELFTNPLISTTTYPRGAARVFSLNLTGGNADLDPETAKSWTFGADFTPVNHPNLTLGATLFDTRFSNQIDRPVAQNSVAALTDPAFSPFVRLIDPSNPADLAAVQRLLDDPAYATPGLYPANAFGAIVDTRYVNTSTLRVRGLDLTGRYRFSSGENDFTASLNATYLIDYSQQLTPTAAKFQRVDLAGQPVDWRVRAALAWSSGPFGATAAVNYVDNYRTAAGRTVDTWTTADVQVTWSPSTPPLDGVVVALSAQNLFDTDPPFAEAENGSVGYDPANADPLGRFLSLQVTKRW